MDVIFDAHNHVFPSLLTGNMFDAGCLRETQYHVRFSGPGGFRRVHDNSPLTETVIVGSGDGISWLPDLGFRLGQNGRVLFTYDEVDYYMQYFPPSYADMSSTPEQVIAQMDFAGVDRAVIQHDRMYGRLDEYLGETLREYPDRFVALAQVEEWRAGEPDQLERLKHQVQDLGFSGLYFSTGGFFNVDFAFGVSDPGLEPLWDMVAGLGVPIHWYADNKRQPRLEQYLNEITELSQWARTHPHITSVLTHGLENLRIDLSHPDRFTVPREIIELIGQPGWHIELMIHKMIYDHEFSPYHPEAPKIVRTLVKEVGAEKLLWGSDMPGCEKVVTYRQSRVLFESRCDFLTEKQRADIMGGNLERMYPPTA